MYYNKTSAYGTSGVLPIPPSNIGALALSSVSVYVRVLIGNTTASYLGLTDVGNATVDVKLTTPNVPYGVLTSSIKSFFVNGGTTEYIQFVFTPYLNATPGVYSFPIHISVDGAGTIVNGTVRLIFDIEKNNPAVVNYDAEAQMSNYGKDLGVSLNIHNPTNKVINNTLVSVRFPSFAAPITGILLAGPQSNETSSRGETSLEWMMPLHTAGPLSPAWLFCVKLDRPSVIASAFHRHSFDSWVHCSHV